MSIACPYCKATLTPKGLKPGKYTPKCPKCGEPFLILVPEGANATVAIQPIARKKPAAVAPPPPRKRPPTPEEVAAAILEGREPPDSTETDEHVPADANATGEFTEPEASPKPAPKPAPKAAPKPLPKTVPMPAPKLPPEAGPKPSEKRADANATGDFTENAEPAHQPPSDATGDFTEHEPAAGAEKPEVAKPVKKSKARTEGSDGADGDAPPRLGGYEVLKVLGKGGMGAVLLGRQISLDRKVALKVMHPKIAQNPNFVARFTREAYAAAQLTHHNVIQIYDIGEDRGQHFFSMEFVQGQSLMDLVKKEGKVAPEVAVGYMLQAARGLRYGHNQGMVHRDIKPDNLMINTEGIVKVADLGLVKLPTAGAARKADTVAPGAGAPSGMTDVLQSEADLDETEAGLTRAGAVMGTPAYMSPEQSRDSATVDHRADIYSLGCAFYVLLTGRTPFEGKTAMEVISKHQTEPLTPPEVVVKRIPKALSGIVMKMTAKKPDDRYQTMDEVIVALEGFLGMERAGTFNPKEEQADQLEKCCHQFNYRSKAGLKKSLTLGFVLVCLLGIVGGALAGGAALAGGFLGLLLMTPLAYFVIHGTLTGGVVFPKARAVVFGMRFFDWAMWVGGGLLFLMSLYLFGMLWSWLGFALLAVGLGFGLWFLTDRSQGQLQEPPLEEARGLFKSLRLSGLDEEQLRQFVCKFSGSNWEPFYEALFGYEAKLAARTFRKGNTGEESKKVGAWREVVLGWLDARLEARRLAKERQHLQKVEAKALEAEGVSKGDARAQAEAMAADLVDQVAEAKQARKQGKEVSVLAIARAARERRRPKPGYNLAGVKMKSQWLKDFVTNWLGRRFRVVLGAIIFALGLVWMNQNDLFGRTTNVFKQVMEFDFSGAQKSLDAATGKPLRVPDFLPVPAELLQPLSSVNVPILGFLAILSGVFYFGWRPNLVVVPGLIIGIAGPMLGIPAVDPLSANLLCLIVGAILILPVAWVLRQ